jgi:orotidine-5'-phosphate decarboxylase
VNRNTLVYQIKRKKSFLCVGLDTDSKKIPPHLLDEENPMLSFNKAIIDATSPFCVSYKINTAFYEAQGALGWETMQQTLDYIPADIFTIADAKRGDIGNTSDLYARAFFESLNFDSITLAPYMGQDSLSPFFAYENKWGIVLALTSNPGSADFEQQQVGENKLYERVVNVFSSMASDEQLMFVVGATKPEELGQIRKQVPNYFFLVPGVGAQGGSLEDVVKHGINKDCGLLINASRSIIYASDGLDFAEKAAHEASIIANNMAGLLVKHHILT